MPRALRIEYPGAIYHLMNRGDRREPIFRDDFDRRRFLTTLAEACQKADWQVHAYCLMLNHFHLVLETPNANLVAGMRWFLSTYQGRWSESAHRRATAQRNECDDEMDCGNIAHGHLDASGQPIASPKHRKRNRQPK